MTGLDPGFLAHRVAIERPVDTADGSGGVARSFAPLGNAWAAIVPLQALETAGFGRLATRLTHRVTLRHRDDVAAGMRLVHRGHVLKIAACRDPDETRRFVELDCVEEAP